MKKLLCLVSLLCGATLLDAQTWGPIPALAEKGLGTFTEPALLGLEPGFGLGYWGQSLDPSHPQGFLDNSLVVNAGVLQWAYQFTPAARPQKLSLAVPFAPGFLTSASVDLDNAYTWSAAAWHWSLLTRPWAFVSLGGSGTYVPQADPVHQISVGVRPLAGLPGWEDSLAVGLEWTQTQGNWAPGRAQAKVRLGEAVELWADWHLGRQQAVAGLAFGLPGQELAAAVKTGPIPTVSAGSFLGQTRFKAPLVLPSSVLKLEGALYRSGPGIGGAFDNLSQLKSALQNPGLKAVVWINPQLETGFADLEDLIQVFDGFRQRGGQLYLYGTVLAPAAYWLGAAVKADIRLAPAGALDLRGLGITQLYWKDFLADWGIRLVNLRSHDTKTAFNPLSESRMTAGEKENFGRLLETFDSARKAWLRQKTGLEAKQAGDLLAAGPYLVAEKALAAKLIDGLAYPDQYFDRLKEKLGDPATFLPLPNLFVPAASSWPAPGLKVVVLHAQGDIIDGRGVKHRSIGDQTLSADLAAARTNPGVAGVILCVDSGGGSALASDLIAREVALYREAGGKPLYVVMGNAAASGGYYISAPARKIFARPTTVTGSIGVVGFVPDVSGLLAKLKINADSVKTADNAEFQTPLRPLTPADRAVLDDSIQATYERFKALVVKWRPLTGEQLEPLAQGRVWTGEQALANGLIDALGGLDEALNSMAGELNQPVVTEDWYSGDDPDALAALLAPWGVRLNQSELSVLLAQPVLQKGLEQVRRYAAYKPGQVLAVAPEWEELARP